MLAACSGDETDPDAGVTPGDAASLDAISLDATPVDAGAEDAEVEDAGFMDAAPVDMGFMDAAPVDMGFMDAGPVDMGFMDAAPVDMGFMDAAAPDATPMDATPMDATAPDAAPMDATAPDATPVDAGGAVCDVSVNTPETNAGQVGASGGSPANTLECGAGAEIIGVALRVSNQNTSNGGPSAVGLTIICASVEIGAGGASVGPETTFEASGTGAFGWTPATQSTLTRCPPGWLVSGLDISRGASNNRFLEMTLTCSELAATGATTGATQSFYVMGSGMEAGNHDTVACASGAVVRRIATRTGAGFDAASLLCGTPACAP